MALLNPANGTQTQQFGPVPVGVGGREWQPTMYGNADYAYWQPYKGWPWVKHFHNGLDIGAGQGTPIMASEAGTVRIAGWQNNGGGNVVAVEIKSGVRYEHAHCSQLHVSVGQRVARGQLIARVGATGAATGNHTHFTVTVREVVNGVTRTIYHNPRHYLPGGKWANSGLIVPDSTWGRVAGDGVNIRNTNGTLFARGVNGRIRRYSDNADLGATGNLVAFGGFVSGSSHGIQPHPTEWARLWYGNAYRLVARPLMVTTAGATGPSTPTAPQGRGRIAGPNCNIRSTRSLTGPIYATSRADGWTYRAGTNTRLWKNDSLYIFLRFTGDWADVRTGGGLNLFIHRSVFVVTRNP